MENKYIQYKEQFPEDFLIRHKVTSFPEKQNFHIHDVFEIVFVCSGDTMVYVGNNRYDIPANSVMIFNNMDFHLITMEKPSLYDRYVLYFQPAYIESLSSKQTDLLECFFYRPFPDSQFLFPSSIQASALNEYLQKILDCQNGCHSYGQDLMLKFLLGELLIILNDIYRETHQITLNSVRSGYSQVYSVINYIHQHLDEELSLNQLSQIAFVNKRYLCTLFKNVTGMSPNQYVIDCRIMKAKDLLSQSISVDDVCGLVGYNNLSHFSRTFKQHTGISPKKFALKNKETH